MSLEHPTETPHEITPSVPVLQPEHIAFGHRIFANRIDLVRSLPRRGRIAEVGTWEGQFARRLLDDCAPAELHLFEWDPSRILPSVLDDERVTLHEGDSSVQLATTPDGYFDWIYIDADHSFEGVRRDIDVAKHKIKPDGVLVLNDYTLWSMLQMMPYGIVQNVNRLCVEEGFEIIAFAFQFQGYHDIAVRRR